MTLPELASLPLMVTVPLTVAWVLELVTAGGSSPQPQVTIRTSDVDNPADQRRASLMALLQNQVERVERVE